jgi:hypothetical protein
MHLEKTIPFTWEGWDDQDPLAHSYYKVEFVEDFGEFKSGEKFSSIFVDYSAGIIEAYNNEGTEVIKSQKYKAIPIN